MTGIKSPRNHHHHHRPSFRTNHHHHHHRYACGCLCGHRDKRVFSNGGISDVFSGRRLLLFLLVLAIGWTGQHPFLAPVHETDGNHLPSGENGGITIAGRKPARTDGRLNLRYDWTDLSPTLNLTKHIRNHQFDCSKPMSTFTYRNRFGLGSDLHIYSRALALGLDTNRRIRTVGNWSWMDQSECEIADGGVVNNKRSRKQSSSLSSSNRGPEFLGSPMRCYFARSELNCPGDVEYAVANPRFDANNSLSRVNGNFVHDGDYVSEILPSKKDGGEDSLITAAVESLFTGLTPRVVREAERQLNLVFGGRDKIPSDLITVHIRWGDKVAVRKSRRNRLIQPEMKKVEISDYIRAVNQILDKRERMKRKNSPSQSTGPSQPLSSYRTANIYLATADPEAVKEFRKLLPIGWNLFVDQFLVESTRHLTDKSDQFNVIPKMAKEFNGKTGLLALGSLLVAMEADDFVLTMASNWSRLMNELRLAILDPRCGECTTMIDLRP